MRIQNRSAVPDVSSDFHTLSIESVEDFEGEKYGEPGVMVTRIKMLVRVQSKGHESNSWYAYMSDALGPKSILGSIYRAALGKDPGQDIETDDLIGARFRAMVGKSEGGWPKIVPGTVAPAPNDGTEPPF